MKVISLIFHPLLLSSYLMVIFYFYLPEIFNPVGINSIPTLILATFITTFLIPVLSVAILKMTSRVSSLELTKREERILPFISITMFYGAATYMFISKLMIVPPLSIMMITSTALIFLLLLITLKFKISIHATAIWGICGLMAALSVKLSGLELIIPLVITAFSAGLVSSSRLHLNFHSPKEIWVGSFLGFFFCFTCIYIFG